MCQGGNYDDEVQPSVWRNTTRRARKAHRCSTCTATIQPGETYREHVSIFDNHPYSGKACATCIAVIDDFGRDHHELHSPGSIVDALERCIYEGDDGVERWEVAYEAIRARRGGTFAEVQEANCV